MKSIIIDFEFTGLDNSFISDNEIVQFKAMNTETGETICVNYNSGTEIKAYSYLIHKIHKYEGNKFSDFEFRHALSRIGASIDDTFYGFGTTQDKFMLKKYMIDIKIKDIREMFQLSEYDSKLAIEGSGLEVVYLIVTNEIPESTNHNGEDELCLMKKLFDVVKGLKLKTYFEVMPHGHCAGMPLTEYVQKYRRASDGYRFNNNDLLSNSLTHVIESLEPIWDDEDDWEVDESGEEPFN